MTDHTSYTSAVTTRQILVIDDHANIAKLVEAYLAKARIGDVVVEHAVSIEEALHKIDELVPDIILLDNLLPPHFDFRNSIEALRGMYMGHIVLFSGEIPPNLGKYDIDDTLAGVLSKDDIATGMFPDLIRKLI